jgi:arsenite methyltransferase
MTVETMTCPMACPERIVMSTQEDVRRRYAAAARAVAEGHAGCGGGTTTGSGAERTGCCGGGATTSVGAAAGVDTATGCCGDPVQPDAEAGAFGARLYSPDELAKLPAGIRQASLGCGNPIAVAELQAGETVLDLGSGAGGDVLLSARRVGPAGRVYGLDMTEEMLEVARRHAADAGMDNVEFRLGTIEQIPLPPASVDVVISNCVINLSTDKPAVFAEMFRVLRSGGRVGVTDVVAHDDLTPAQRAERGDWAGCVAGALSHSEYVDGLSAAGFTHVEVVETHRVTDGMASAIIRAVKP